MERERERERKREREREREREMRDERERWRDKQTMKDSDQGHHRTPSQGGAQEFFTGNFLHRKTRKGSLIVSWPDAFLFREDDILRGNSSKGSSSVVT